MTAGIKMFSEKRWNLSGLKALIKKIVSTALSIDCGHIHRTNVHFICRLYLIILLTEVRDMLYVMYFATVSLWLSLLATCKTFNVFWGKYLLA